MATIRRLLETSEQGEEARRVGGYHSSLGDGADRQHRPGTLDADETAAAWAQPV